MHEIAEGYNNNTNQLNNNEMTKKTMQEKLTKATRGSC